MLLLILLIVCILLCAASVRCRAAGFAVPGETEMFFDMLKDPEHWKMIRNHPGFAGRIDKIRENLPCKDKGLPRLEYSYRHEIKVSGDRKCFEKPYFTRRGYMHDNAVLAMLYPEEPEYLINAQDAIWTICSEYNWVLSAHTDSVLSWAETVDLGAAGTAWQLAFACMLLEDRLDRETLIMVREQIRRRISEPFETRTFSWNTATHNWTSVCVGNIAMALMYFEPETVKRQEPRIIKAMDCYLSGFTREGCCLEGIGYWEYGFSHFVWCADMLKRFTGGKTDLFADKRAEIVAAYPQKQMLKGGATVSYADGERRRRLSRSLCEYLRVIYPDTVKSLPDENYFTDLYKELIFGIPKSAYSPAESSEYYLEEAQQVAVNRPAYSFAFKAGCNQEPHNHNDIGSFIIADSSGQVFCDPGLGLYTKAYFEASERYKHLVTASRGHSVPIINGSFQTIEGVGAMTKQENRAVLDLTHAYGIQELKKAERCFEWDPDGITLTDCFEGNIQVTERFVSAVEPEIKNGAVYAGNIILSYPPELRPVISTETYVDNMLQTERLWFVDFELTGRHVGFRFEVKKD